jgi:hypothetical protein
VDELIKIFIFAVCDVYHRKPHGGLGGDTPHNAMVKALKEYEIDAPPSDAEMFMIFGLPQKRALQSDGVVSMGIQYNSDRLQRLRTKTGLQEIEIKVDTECAAFVAAEDENGWFLVRNLCGLDETVTLWEWMAARNARRKANARDTADDKDVYLSGLSRLRETGEAARLRAGLAHRALNDKQLAELDRELFGQWTAPTVETGYVYDPGEVVMPEDPLLRPRLPAGVIARPSVGGLIPASEATAKQLAAAQRHPDPEPVLDHDEEELERSPFAEEDED